MTNMGALGLLVAGAVTAAAWAQPTRPVPYWASLTAGDALMRTGPGRNYPASWRYRRVGLPLKVVAVHESWRKVREPDGTEGWMASVLLTDRRTAMVRGEVLPLRVEPSGSAPIRWRAAPGVIGRISRCRDGWCLLDVNGRQGFAATAGLWGVEAGEAVE